MGEADCFQKAMECTKIPYHTLTLNLLLNIQPDIRFQGISRIFGIPYQGQQTELQCCEEIESFTEFSRHERVHNTNHGAAGKQVNTGTLEFTRTGTGENKSRPAGFLNKLMNDSKQFGNSLHFVYDHIWPAGCRAHEFTQALRPCRIAPLVVRGQQIHPHG